ncbi:AAA family ATPase [Streptococcus sp. Marseille-Q6488]|uniref:AAA family ATPase n=1 Tax=Streptococcus sp. Marseille-Q6488 TaxID=2972783 RepID=UPI002263D4FF|nr:AAA family ATPase [Streptococcus sp. Marseille-Q6488]
MDVTYKFLDNPKEINISIEGFSVLYGDNGVGKTRILKILSSIANLKEISSSVLELLEKNNLEYIKINNESLLSIFDGENRENKLDDNLYDNFINDHSDAFKDLCIVFSEIINKNRFIPFFPVSKFVGYNRRIERILERGTRKNLYHEISMLINGITYLLHEIERSVRNIDIAFDTELINLSKDILGYISRNFDNYKFKNSFRGGISESLNKDFFSEPLFQNKNSKYISPELSEFKSAEALMTRELLIAKENCANYKIKCSYDSDATEYIKDITYYIERLALLNDFLARYCNIIIEVNMENYSSIIARKNGDEIELSFLSSGEQRLITLLTNCIFSDEKIILIDEPEISLSIKNQSKLILDMSNILKQANKTLIIATHAPYIFQACKELGFNRVEI